MRKDRTIISELQEYFLQNDDHLAINSISDVMSSLELHKNKIRYREGGQLQVHCLADISPSSIIPLLHGEGCL